MKAESGRRGQTAIYDGITFLLLVSFSSSLVYVFVASYGQTEDSALKASYQLNYLQSVTKAFYYLDASELKYAGTQGKSPDAGIPPYNSIEPRLTDPVKGCEGLMNYKYSLADLLKRDLADPEDPRNPVKPVLDDKFGPIYAPGRQGARCAMKELMKPLVYSGYEYAVDVIEPKNEFGFIDVETGTARVTNNARLSDSATLPNSELIKGNFENGQCIWVQKQNIPLLSMAAPFRVLLSPSGEKEDKNAQTTRDYELRFCIWFKQALKTQT